jgi:iron complex outermembrane recepter protein
MKHLLIAHFVLLLVVASTGTRAFSQPASNEQTPGSAPVCGLSAPVLKRQVPARYPEGETEHAHVHLLLSVDVSGAVTEVTVLESPGARFTAAASTAARTWIFEPAVHDGRAIASRVSVVVSLQPPAPASQPVAEDTALGTAQPSSAPVWVGDDVYETRIVGERDVRARAERAVSDYRFSLGALRNVPREDAAALLTLAPGILLTNEGGEGHPERIFLRGFDAREGQDVALSVDGVPVNEAGNLHGNGYADLNFIIPEAVSELRVVEGPFDLRHGNFAVAGAAEYRLGVTTPGVATKYSTGSFRTHRVVATYTPDREKGETFAAAEIFSTEGYGQNRQALRGSVMAQVTRPLDQGEWALTATAYGTRYKQPGVVRDDDYRAGRTGFFDTYDPMQGGEAMRFSVSGRVTLKHDNVLHEHLVWALHRSMRLRENFTGFLLDTQDSRKTLHAQRGDLLDLDNASWSMGGKGHVSLKKKMLGLMQEIELGYFGRGDFVESSQRRVEATTRVPYALDTDLGSRLANLSIYGELTLRFLPWLTLRGGVRGELFFFNVFDGCAQRSVRRPTRPTGDADCLDQQDFGRYRDPTSRASTASATVLPRATLSVGPFAGLTFSASVGRGIRSIDPIYIVQDVATPFADIMAYEGGAGFAHNFARWRFSAKAAGFATRVDRDLIFSETVGRNQLGGSTLRAGGSLLARAEGAFFDVNAHTTLVRSTFQDTGMLVPYAPDLVTRLDASVFGDLPWPVVGRRVNLRGGLGVTYIGRRPLPYGQRSDAIFVMDLSAAVSWRWVSLGVSVTNLLDGRYRLAEFNYTSDFHSASYPTLLPTRHFVAGAPRVVLFTIGLQYGSDT